MAIAVGFSPGAIANEKGDIYGTSPFRILRFGRLVIARERVGDELMFGWREVPEDRPDCDDDFAWLERTEADREALDG